MQSISGLVLVTGSNGYLGSHVVQQLLKNGYNIRAAVRSENAANEMTRIHADNAARLTTTIVPDITIEGAFDEAVKDVQAASATMPLRIYHQLTCVVLRLYTWPHLTMWDWQTKRMMFSYHLSEELSLFSNLPPCRHDWG